ncbi:MAG: ubiquitinyl hydrolase 1 [Bogoriella megaspora]|nr:MAG: ubiquitinyl hydrolase 1 [Bogoriella megaspora]
MTLPKKHFIPLESDPTIFTHLAHHLGLSPRLAFIDVLSLSEPSLLALVPRPALALILTFPASKDYDARLAAEDADKREYEGYGEGEDVLWFRQTIGNACGLYGLLHAVGNVGGGGWVGEFGFNIFTLTACFVEGEEVRVVRTVGLMMYELTKNVVIFLRLGSALLRLMLAPLVCSALIRTCIPLPPAQRSQALEASQELEQAHREAAVMGQSAVPEDAEEEVDFHYLCFAKSSKSGRLYELDGDRKGPIHRGIIPDGQDLLDEYTLRVVREKFLSKKGEEELGFNLMALVDMGSA